PTAMIQSMSGNNLKYQSNHALPTTIRVMGKPAFLMNPPRQTLDPEIASVANWADKKIPEFIAISQRRLLMMRQICRVIKLLGFCIGETNIGKHVASGFFRR